jgi:PPIC-type PPIASE domain
VSISGTSADDAAAMSDPILLENEFHEVDEQTVSKMFGADFAWAIFSLKPGSWAGPVKSGYGVHLVRLTDLRPATLLSFEQVRPKVLEEWRQQQQTQAKAVYLSKLREKYGVVIDGGISRSLAPPPIEAKTQ